MMIAKNLASLREDTTVYRAPTGLAARLFAKAVIERGGANLFVVENDRAARELGAMARFFQPDLKTLVFPAWDSPPYERISPSPTVAAQRCAVLTMLANKPRNEPVLVVATAAALSQLVPPLSYFQGETGTNGVKFISQMSPGSTHWSTGWTMLADNGIFTYGIVRDLTPPEQD